MPIGKEKIELGGIVLQNGICAVVEVGNYVQEPEEALMSDLFVPLEVEVGEMTEELLYRKCCLANVEAIVGPCCVVPDIGGGKNAYLQAKRRKDWANLFVLWFFPVAFLGVMLQSVSPPFVLLKIVIIFVVTSF